MFATFWVLPKFEAPADGGMLVEAAESAGAATGRGIGPFCKAAVFEAAALCAVIWPKATRAFWMA